MAKSRAKKSVVNHEVGFISAEDHLRIRDENRRLREALGLGKVQDELGARLAAKLACTPWLEWPVMAQQLIGEMEDENYAGSVFIDMLPPSPIGFIPPQYSPSEHNGEQPDDANEIEASASRAAAEDLGENL